MGARLKMGGDGRKHRRQAFQIVAKICTDDLSLPTECQLSDISDGGARLKLASETESVPKEFMLLLSHNEKIRRHCRVAWRNGVSVGVTFVSAPVPER